MTKITKLVKEVTTALGGARIQEFAWVWSESLSILTNMQRLRFSHLDWARGKGTVSGFSCSNHALHWAGLAAMWVHTLSNGPLRVEAAKIDSQLLCGIQLGCKRVGSKSDKVKPTEPDVSTIQKCTEPSLLFFEGVTLKKLLNFWLLPKIIIFHKARKILLY